MRVEGRYEHSPGRAVEEQIGSVLPQGAVFSAQSLCRSIQRQMVSDKFISSYRNKDAFGSLVRFVGT